MSDFTSIYIKISKVFASKDVLAVMVGVIVQLKNIQPATVEHVLHWLFSHTLAFGKSGDAANRTELVEGCPRLGIPEFRVGDSTIKEIISALKSLGWVEMGARRYGFRSVIHVNTPEIVAAVLASPHVNTKVTYGDSLKILRELTDNGGIALLENDLKQQGLFEKIRKAHAKAQEEKNAIAEARAAVKKVSVEKTSFVFDDNGRSRFNNARAVSVWNDGLLEADESAVVQSRWKPESMGKMSHLLSYLHDVLCLSDSEIGDTLFNVTKLWPKLYKTDFAVSTSNKDGVAYMKVVPDRPEVGFVLYYRDQIVPQIIRLMQAETPDYSEEVPVEYDPWREFEKRD